MHLMNRFSTVITTVVLMLAGCTSGGGSNECDAGFYGDNCNCQAGTPTIVDFSAMATVTVPSLVFPDPMSVDGIITGSADISILNLNGIGVVGGLSDYYLDGVESLTFAFTEPVVEVSYYVFIANNNNGVGLPGESIVEPFDDQNMSYGSFPVGGGGTIDVSALIAQDPISSFTITADIDATLTRTLTYSPLVCTP